MSTTNASAVSSISKAAAVVAVAEEKKVPDELHMQPTLITSSCLLKGADPFSNNTSAAHGDGSWEGSDFFKDNPFASSLFETDLATGDSGSKDAFGFPTKPVSGGVLGSKASKTITSNAICNDAKKIFNHDVVGLESWGDPTGMVPVAITPRIDNAERRFNENGHRHESVDANSYDESEMSEVTDPTFSSLSLIQTAKGKNIADTSDSSIKENHERESRQHTDQSKKMLLASGSALLIEKRCTVNGDPPLMSLDTIVSHKNEREDKNRDLDSLDTSITTLPVAKSRILSKYASSGKVRRASVQSSVHGKDKIEVQSTNRSIGSAGSSSLTNATGKLRMGQATSPATKPKGSTSSNLNSARKTGAATAESAAAAAAASGIALAETSSMSGGVSPAKQQHRGTSLSLNPRSKSPVRISTAFTAGNSSRSIGSAGSSSLNSATGKLRIGHEASPAMKPKASTSSNPNSARKSGATTAVSAAAASGIALAEISSMSGGVSPVKQQHRGTSPTLNRRRKSPVRISTASTAGNSSLMKQSSPTRSPTRKYDSSNRKKKVSPSVVENPAYYSVSVYHFYLVYGTFSPLVSYVSHFLSRCDITHGDSKMETRLGQIKDPIQRAGVKLLWAAAIPIQTQARRFMARQAAIRRMCAVLTIQAVSVQSIAKSMYVYNPNLSHPILLVYPSVCPPMDRRA